MIAPIQQNRIGSYYDDQAAERQRVSDTDSEPSLQIVRETIGNHPVAALAVAAVVGATAAWIIKRGVR